MDKGTETRFEDTCEITGVDNGVTVTGEILEFREGDRIVATIQRSAKVTLRWHPQAGVYIGSMGGIEFRSPGPKAYTYRTRRH